MKVNPRYHMQKRISQIQGMTTTTILRLLAIFGLITLLLMARHSSTEATVLGRWSSRYALLLAYVTIATLLTALLK